MFIRLVFLFFFSFYFVWFDHETEVVHVDDFEKGQVDQFPNGWEGRKEEARKYYTVSSEGIPAENKYLRVVNESTDMFIIKKIQVDLVKYPYLNWKWRAHQLPPKGREDKKKYCDVVASVNVVLKASKWKPRSIKYSWSTDLAEKTFTKSPYAFWPSRCDIVVLQSGHDEKGQWITEKRNVLEDYLHFYNKKKKPKSLVIEAIVLMSDGDNTGSVVKADYDDIFFSN